MQWAVQGFGNIVQEACPHCISLIHAVDPALEVRSGRNGQEQGGIVAASDSKTIYALLVAWDAPLAVSKIDSLKQFGPSENQLFDGTAIQARYLYDLFVPKNKQVAIGALVQA